jgi:AcrR family transcriptional regulator
MRAERIPQIIQAAMVVFARDGFAQTRMEDIAQAAGLSKATLYLYFADKDDIIFAILQSFIERGFTELSTLVESESLVSASLLAWTRQRMQEMQENPAFIGIGFEFHAIAARQEATRHALQRYYHQYQNGIAALIQKGIARGELQAADPQELALAILGIYEGLLVLWTLDPATIDLVRVAERTVQALLRGFAQAA